MNENVLQIEPLKSLGFYKLDSNLNYIISEIKSRGERYEHVDLVVGESGNDRNEAIFLILNKEGIKLRFDQIYQRLEMIEIDMKNIYKERRHSVHFKNHILINPSISNCGIGGHPILNYNYIITIFGLSSVPKIIENNKYILLRYNGISFLFENNENISVSNLNTSITEDNFILSYFSEAILVKICIFSENFLIDSISRENDIFKISIPLIKVDIDKGIFITFDCSTSSNLSQAENENISNNYDIHIPYFESLQNILFHLKNPNFIFYKSNENFDTNGYDSDSSLFVESSPSYYCNKEDQDFILNYYSLGLDIIIDSSSHTAKKFILHTNNPFDIKFGVYNKCNFNIELTKNFFKKLEKINESNSIMDRESMNINTNGNNISICNINSNNNYTANTPSNKSRKISEDSTNKVPFHSNSDEKGELSINMNMNYSYSENIGNEYCSSCNTINLKIEKTNNFLYENKRFDEYTSSGLGYKDHYVASINNNTSGKDFKDDNIQFINSNYYAKRKRTEYMNQKLSVESREMINPGEKSFCSMNESNISISLNTSDIFMNMNILPNTNFSEILNRFPQNSFFVYLRQEPKLNILSKYYAFDGIIFEVLENQSLASITLFKPLLKC